MVPNTKTPNKQAGTSKLEAHLLRFVYQVETPLRMQAHKGSALRGAWAEALLARSCPQPQVCGGKGCAMPHGCPIAALVGPSDEQGPRGRDVPRPYVIEPPLDSRAEYAPGDPLEWRMVLFGRAVEWFPYVVTAARLMGERGLGLAGNNGRGRSRLREIWAINPLSGLQQRLLGPGEATVQSPSLPLTSAQALRFAAALPGDRITLRFHTPLRLGQERDMPGERRLVHELPPFHLLVTRLAGRLRDLATYYGGVGATEEWSGLPLDLARQVAASGKMEWLDLQRFSSRQDRRLPMGGLRGQVTFSGDLKPFLLLLVWGQFAHAGKYAVMGNGGYSIEESFEGAGTGGKGRDW